MKKLISLVLLAAFASSCSHVPFDDKKPVQFQRGFWQAGFAQDGQFVEPEQAEHKLREVPAAAEKLDSATHWALGGLGVGLAGVAVALTAPHDSPNGYYDSGQYWIGLGVIIFGSLPFNIMAGKRLNEAADVYDKERFTVTPKTTTNLYLAPVKSGGIAGVQLQF